jgi:hypothetical protein
MSQGVHNYSNDAIGLNFMLSEGGSEILWVEVADKKKGSIDRGKGEWRHPNFRTVDPDYDGPLGWYEFSAGGYYYEFEEPSGKNLKLTRSRNGKSEEFNLKEGQMKVAAKESTKHHRAVYNSINEGLKHFDKRTVAFKHEGVVCQLEGWVKDGEFVKIVVKCPSDENFGCEEYYIENGKPLFVYRVRDMLDGETGEVMVKGAENRFYFRGGQLFKWLDFNKSEVSADDEFFSCEGDALLLNCKKFIIALSSTGN